MHTNFHVNFFLCIQLISLSLISISDASKSSQSKRTKKDAVTPAELIKAAKPKKRSSSSTNGADGASVKKSFAPKGELSKQADANNITVWDGFLGGDFSLRLHQYLNTSKYYIGLRRNGNIGSNMSIDYFWSLFAAMEAMAIDNPTVIPLRPAPVAGS
jgi:hypothetical protein